MNIGPLISQIYNKGNTFSFNRKTSNAINKPIITYPVIFNSLFAFAKNLTFNNILTTYVLLTSNTTINTNTGTLNLSNISESDYKKNHTHPDLADTIFIHLFLRFIIK